MMAPSLPNFKKSVIMKPMCGTSLSSLNVFTENNGIMKYNKDF